MSLGDQEDPKNDYIKEKKVGEGTYAVVYLGTQKRTKRRVAIKKIKMGQFKDGMDMSALREVKVLQEMKHENIIELVEVFASRSNLNLVLEYLDTDLEILIKDHSIVFSMADVKSWMLMTLRGLHYIHQRFVLHRDLKPNNLLISSNGLLKLADFGLARDFASNAYLNMTSQVVTRWYRAPELLLGAKSYGTGVDIWACGAIFAELMLRRPYLPGNNDIEQLDITFNALGTPSEKEWPLMQSLPDYVEFKNYPKPPQGLGYLFSAADDDALELLETFLQYNPTLRPTAKEALLKPFFLNLPRPTKPSNLPRKGGGLRHVAETLKRKADSLENLELGQEKKEKKISRRLNY